MRVTSVPIHSSISMPHPDGLQLSYWMTLRTTLIWIRGQYKKLLRRFGVAVPDYTCWRARKLMKNVVEGRHDEGYKVFSNYMRVFKEKNPDSLCFIN